MSHLVCHTAPRFALCAIAVLTIASARAEEAAATRAASINERCGTLGKGTEKLASIRDRGVPRAAAISELVGNKPPPERFKTEIEFMVGFAYEFPRLVPAAVGMLAFGACTLSSVGLLDSDAAALLSHAAEACQAAHPKDDAEVRSCIDKRIADHLASKTHAPPAADIARDPPGDGCAEALANPEVLKLVRRALAEEEAGQLREAIETGKQALGLYPRNECQLNTIAGLYGKLREPEQEVTWARKALEVRPTFALAYVNLGNAYAAMNQGSQATDAFKRAAALDPKSPLPLYGLGVLSEQQGRAQEALELYRKSVAVAPSFEDGYFNLAVAAANLKRFDEARAALERVLQLNPKAEDARAMLRRIDGAARR